MGVAGANMQWGRFVLPQLQSKEESTAFELILRSAWGLSSPGKQVGRSRTPCWKRSHVWGRESDGGRNICSSRDASVGNGKHFEKQAQSFLRVNISDKSFFCLLNYHNDSSTIPIAFIVKPR